MGWKCLWQVGRTTGRPLWLTWRECRGDGKTDGQRLNQVEF